MTRLADLAVTTPDVCPPPVIILELSRARRLWFGNVPARALFEFEEQGRLRLIRMGGKVFVAADDAQVLLDSLRPPGGAAQSGPVIPKKSPPDPITITVREAQRLT